MLEISPEMLKKKMNAKECFILLDVRTKEERGVAVIAPSQWIPLDSIKERQSELDKAKRVVVYCHRGVRSAVVAELLRENGFDAVSLKGGIDAWSREVDSQVPTY